MRTRDLWQMHRRSLVAERRSKYMLAFYESAIRKWERWLDAAGVSDDLEKLTRLDLLHIQVEHPHPFGQSEPNPVGRGQGDPVSDWHQVH